MPLGAAHASGARLAVPVFPESPDKSREVGGVPGWDLGGGCQMLKAACPNGPGGVAPEDLTDPTLLCCRSSGGAVRDTPHPEPGNPMATLGRRLPRIVCVRLGSARQLVELKVVRRLLSLWPLMEWAVVFFPVLSAAAGYLLDGVHVQDIARAFAK